MVGMPCDVSASSKRSTSALPSPMRCQPGVTWHGERVERKMTAYLGRQVSAQYHPKEQPGAVHRSSPRVSASAPPSASKEHQSPPGNHSPPRPKWSRSGPCRWLPGQRRAAGPPAPCATFGLHAPTPCNACCSAPRRTWPCRGAGSPPAHREPLNAEVRRRGAVEAAWPPFRPHAGAWEGRLHYTAQ